jgi:glycosyltransferase involved in cell wall biosynthesis
LAAFEKTMKNFSFIIPAYNEEALLPATLENLNNIIKDVFPEYSGEIIVVDNNSNDRTAYFAEKYGARVLYEPENCIARARNRGAQAADGEYLVFVDADTLPEAETVKKALDLMDSGEICGGGARVRFDLERLPFFAELIVLWWETVTFFIPLAAGSFLFCHRKAWEETGGFYEKLYASEEVNFSYKLKKWGRKNNMRFKLLKDRVLTSARKVEYFSSVRMFFFIMLNCCFPFLVRSRKCCYMWYKRP